MNTTGTSRSHLMDLLLPPDALLQAEKGSGTVVAKGEHFAVEHRAVGQATGGRHDFRKARRDQLLATRPEMHLAASASHELRPDAVPFPLDEPRARVAERRRVRVERRGEVERIGT